MRVLIFNSLVVFFILTNASYAKQLVYVLVDPTLSLKNRSVVSDFFDHILKSKFFKDETLIYLHIDGLKVHFPKMSLINPKSNRDRKSINATLTNIAKKKDYFLKIRPRLVENTTPNTVFGRISKNLIGIKKEHGVFEDIFLIQFANLDFSTPAKTSNMILGDGWITAPNGPFNEFISGSQSRAMRGVNVFAVLEEPKELPITWMAGRKGFLQRLYSSTGANLRAVNRIGLMQYGGGAVLSYKFRHLVENDTQSLPKILPIETNLIQVIDPSTMHAETVQ